MGEIWRKNSVKQNSDILNIHSSSKHPQTITVLLIKIQATENKPQQEQKEKQHQVITFWSVWILYCFSVSVSLLYWFISWIKFLIIQFPKELNYLIISKINLSYDEIIINQILFLFFIINQRSFNLVLVAFTNLKLFFFYRLLIFFFFEA